MWAPLIVCHGDFKSQDFFRFIFGRGKGTCHLASPRRKSRRIIGGGQNFHRAALLARPVKSSPSLGHGIEGVGLIGGAFDAMPRARELKG